MIDIDFLAPLVIAARTLLALVFLTAAIGKLRDHDAFHNQVHAYRILSERLVALASTAIPSAELALGLMLPTGLLPLGTGFAAAALLFVFAGAMAVNLRRGRRHIDCGCFQGRAAQHLSMGVVLRTAGLGLCGLGAAFPVVASLSDAVQGLVAGGILFVLFTTIASLPAFGRQRPRISL